MAYFLTIDGDDIGDKIACSFIENNPNKLKQLNQKLKKTISIICTMLEEANCEIIMCAADGITCQSADVDIEAILGKIALIGEPEFTFSIGIGHNLHDAFFALKYAKALGKNIAVYNHEQEYKVIESFQGIAKLD